MTTEKEFAIKLIKRYEELCDDKRFIESSDLIFEELALEIKQIKTEWCKQQRESCLNNYKKKRGENLIKILETEDTEEINGVWDLNNSILNAPEP